MKLFDIFMSFDKSVQAAIIAAIGAMLVAGINGVFGLIKPKEKNKSTKKDSNENKVTINQTANNNATQIGIQINKKEEE